MTWRDKLKSYLVFTKFRLSALVVISALSGYLFVVFRDGAAVNSSIVWLLMVGGSLVTAASNGSNQIWEKEIDILMKRTQGRPLPQGKMTIREAYIVVSICLIIGTYLLYRINLLCAILGFAAYVSYVFIYTPMKRVSPWAVFVGAFPGAIPPMLGWIAFTGEMSLQAIILFAIQFIWQFPHFWALAWMLEDDYKKAGFEMLPAKDGRSKTSALQIMVYTGSIIPFGLLPYFFRMSGIISAVIITLCGIYFMMKAIKLHATLEISDARKLLYASFIYLPVVQLALLIDKL